MHTLANLSKALNRPAVYLQGLQKRFALPILKDATYSDSYLMFLHTVISLRTLNISENAIALLKTYIVVRTRIQSTITAEIPHLRSALRLANRIGLIAGIVDSTRFWYSALRRQPYR